jgi:predicted  nucleic acid-binding Zn-ribbon protein
MQQLSGLVVIAVFAFGHGLGLSSADNRPISKVTTLLKDMLTTLEKEAAEDQKIYDQMACWCTTNDQAKTKAIADAEAHIKNLDLKIEELTATSARLNEEIATLSKEVAANQKALAAATKNREDELAAFNAEEQNLLETIATLKSAIETLSKHQGGSFVQVKAVLKHHLATGNLDDVLSPSERSAAAAFVQSTDLDYFDKTSQPGGGNSYAPQSGQIFGILQQMQETFEGDLSNAQKEELAAQKAYEELKAAKEAEIAAGQAQIATKTQELADTDEANAQAKIDKEDTFNTMTADQQYLMKLKEQCSLTDKEYEERVKTRNLEIEACSKAMQVLSSDEAMDLMSRTFSLAQEAATMKSQRRTDAADLLSKKAQELHSPRLAALAMRVKLDAFTKVKKAIDDLVAQLLQDKADEIKHKDFCVSELNTNQLQTEEKTRQKTDLQSKIEDLTMKIEELAKAIANLKAEVGDLQLQLKRAGEDREAQNKEFQTVVTDQRQAQKLLQAAVDILSEFYGKKAALMQQEPAGPPPPAGFKAMKPNAQSGGVMSMINQIIEDTKAMEAEAIKAETDASNAYAVFVQETKASVDEKAADIANKEGTKAKLEEELVETKQSKAEVVQELEDLATYNAELHTSCDYVLKNFDIRQKARDEEVEALRQAKAILSGAKFEAFLQGK